MRIPTETKVLYETLSHIIDPYKELILHNYDRLYNIPIIERDKNYNYRISDYLDMATCIAEEIEREC